MNQEQGVNQLPDGILRGGTPGDARVFHAAGIESEIVRIKRHDDTLLRSAELELLGIAQPTPSGVLRG